MNEMIPRAAFLIWSLGGLTLAASGGAAQAPADRAALERLRDSLSGVTDSVPLKRLEAATIEVAKVNRDDALLHLRLGFIDYRLGELAGKPHYDDAASEFEWAGDLQPGWPYPWYGDGLSELAIGEHPIVAIENLRQILGKDYLSKAARAFARAAQADPTFASAVIDLATTALDQRIQARLDVALQAVRLAAASGGDVHPELDLARGRVERAVGEADSALVGFEAYLRAGGDTGLGDLELARTLYFAKRPDAGRARYFEGAAAASSGVAIAAYREDCSWIATPAELAAYDQVASGPARAAWLERFWSRRDVEDVREPGERLAEHYRRWFYAEHNFRLVSRHRHYDITEVFRPAQKEFDDRGIVYLRQGEPDDRATYHSTLLVAGAGADTVEPNETWLYRRPGGDLLFHFVARHDDQDYKLVESLADVLGFAAAVQAQARVTPQIADLYASRDRLDPLFARVAAGTANSGSALAEERRRGRESIRIGTSTDRYHQSFPQSLRLVASDFVVGGAARDTDGEALELVFAIPAADLTPVATGPGVRYPLHFRVVLSDSADALVEALDTTRVFLARQALADGTYLTGRLELPVPAGRYRYRLLVDTPDRSAGDVVERDSVDVDSLDGRHFAVSDLVLGRDQSGLAWATGRDTVALNPLDEFPVGGSAELYYEVYGLPRGAPYHTVLTVERLGGHSLFSAIGRLFGGGHAATRLEFDAASLGPSTGVHRGIDLADSPRGEYAVSVTVTDPASGAHRTRTATFRIVSR